MRQCSILVPLLLMSLTAIGQQNVAQSNSRKVVSHIEPSYPELAHRLHIQGVVKVEAQVRANGSVKAARVLGGNPVLADAALTAVEKWRFEADQAETVEVVQVLFGSRD